MRFCTVRLHCTVRLQVEWQGFGSDQRHVFCKLGTSKHTYNTECRVQSNEMNKRGDRKAKQKET
jgi:hypothetical protein